jgi:hypothetical protein
MSRMLCIEYRDIRNQQGHANLFIMFSFGKGITMKVVVSDNNVLKIPKEEIDGASAPIYLIGLPGDTAKLKALIEEKL